jgi:hypothetical protein
MNMVETSLALVGDNSFFGFVGPIRGGRYRLGRSWHALAQLEYSSLPAGNGAAGKVNLGGLNLSLGLMAGIL